MYVLCVYPHVHTYVQAHYSKSLCAAEEESGTDSELQKTREPTHDKTEDVDGGVIAEALLAVVGEGFTVQEGEEGREGEVTRADKEDQAHVSQEEERGM